MRLRYRARREALVDALGRLVPEARVCGVAAGLHLLVVFDAAIDEQALLSAAAARGVGAEGLSWHRIGDGPDGGLVLGFANLSEPAIERGVAALAAAAVRCR
jgi:GntR family transcriptional regulator / MocR family aminotransferase